MFKRASGTGKKAIRSDSLQWKGNVKGATMKRFGLLLCALSLGFILVGCAGSNASSESVPESEIGNVLENPTNYEGKSIMIEGAVFAETTGSDNITIWFAYHDAEQLAEPFAFTIPSEFSVTTGEYVRVEGTVEGETSDVDGADLGDLNPPFPLIKGTNAEVLNAWDGMSPTVNEGTVDHDIA